MASTKRRNKKQPSDASEEDFEPFVRESLERLCEGQVKIIQDISKLKAKVQLNEGALDKISKQFTSLNQSFEELKGEFHDAKCKVDEIEVSVRNHVTQINQMYEHLLSLERYSREYNLPFHKIKECPGKDCLQKIQKLENAHRAGPRSDSKPRAIICKFVSPREIQSHSEEARP